jgi:hypothetical protein
VRLGDGFMFVGHGYRKVPTATNSMGPCRSKQLDPRTDALTQAGGGHCFIDTSSGAGQRVYWMRARPLPHLEGGSQRVGIDRGPDAATRCNTSYR